jgi:leucine dehydrogenase
MRGILSAPSTICPSYYLRSYIWIGADPGPGGLHEWEQGLNAIRDRDDPLTEFDLLEPLRSGGFERLVVCNDTRVGLHAIIAIHSTQLGPANGGVRMLPYGSFTEAARDAMRLAQAMTYKWSVAGEDRGGGKSVIIGDPRTDKSEALLRRFGQFVDELGGRYWVGADAGVTLHDMEVIHRETDYVATLPLEAGGVGDIARATARGTVQAMRACAELRWGSSELAGRTVALQGLGACGAVALEMLVEAGAEVTVCDVEPEKVERAVSRFPVQAVAPEEIHAFDVDIYAPYALGGVINDETLNELRVELVVGSANNLLAEEHHGTELERKGILYVPDFIANAGGAIYDADQFHKGGFNLDRALRSVDRIYERTLEVFALSRAERIPLYTAARRMAESRLSELEPIRRRAR